MVTVINKLKNSFINLNGTQLDSKFDIDYIYDHLHALCMRQNMNSNISDFCDNEAPQIGILKND